MRILLSEVPVSPARRSRQASEGTQVSGGSEIILSAVSS